MAGLKPSIFRRLLVFTAMITLILLAAGTQASQRVENTSAPWQQVLEEQAASLQDDHGPGNGQARKIASIPMAAAAREDVTGEAAEADTLPEAPPGEKEETTALPRTTALAETAPIINESDWSAESRGQSTSTPAVEKTGVGVGGKEVGGEEEIRAPEQESVVAVVASPAIPAVQAPVPPYTRGGTYERHLRVRVQITNKGEDEAQKLRVTVPLLGRIDSPYQTNVREAFSLEPVEVLNGSLRNRSALFVIDSLLPGASKTITLEYVFKVSELTANLAAYVPGQDSAPGAAYLEPSLTIESSHPEIAAQAVELAAGAADDLEKAQAFYRYVVRHIKYDTHSTVRNKGALAALRSAKGVCEEYASLFVALCRSAGIPARQVNGYADPKGSGELWNIDAGGVFPLKGYRHSWAEFYLEGIGWLPADPTMDIYNQTFKYFGSLPRASHIAQNYQDESLRVRHQGGQLAVTWQEELYR